MGLNARKSVLIHVTGNQLGQEWLDYIPEPEPTKMKIVKS